jgi:secondary thiamine-phosphate synthase enzyme
MIEVDIHTQKHTQFLNIDVDVQRVIDASGMRDGFVQIFVPHTTAGITINENADPDVVADMALILERAVPWEGGYAHAEGNSAAHVKASMMGFCQTVLIQGGRLAFGTWQSLYFCEFDGPRRRKIWVQVVPTEHG